MKKAFIITKEITKNFYTNETEVKVLNNINLQFFQGELVMLVGPSGCGKTTLLSIITGILSPTHGEVIMNEVNITKLNDNEKVLFRRKEIGFIFQQYNLFPSLSAVENAAIPLIAANIPWNIA